MLSLANCDVELDSNLGSADSNEIEIIDKNKATKHSLDFLVN